MAVAVLLTASSQSRELRVSSTWRAEVLTAAVKGCTVSGSPPGTHQRAVAVPTATTARAMTGTPATCGATATLCVCLLRPGAVAAELLPLCSAACECVSLRVPARHA
jgi:hypothetical protein